MFNLAGHTPIKSAQLADLYEAMYYLSATKAENTYIETLSTTKE